MEPQATAQPAPPPPSPQQQTPQPNGTTKTNSLAIWGLVLAFFLPIIGLILSIVAKSQIKKTGESGSGLATGGIIVSIVLIIFQILAVIFWIFVISAAVVQDNNSSSNTNSSSTTSTTDTSSYTADEKKAVETSEAFLEAINKSDYNAAYNLMGAELKKEYKGGVSEFQKEVENANLKLIKNWKVEDVTTNGNGDRITVKGSATFSGANPTGTFEFGYYKDTDASIDMYLWQIRPSN